jgi:peptide/nickel transport system permease protein
MLGFLIRRGLSTVPVLAVVGIIVFLLLRLTPGDPAAAIAGGSATPQDIESVRQQLGLDESIVKQFLIWAGHVLTGDLGYSFYYKMSVASLIGQRLEPTISIAVLTMVFAVLVALPTGVLAAWSRGGWLDRLVMGGSAIGFSVPVFAIAYALIWVFAMQLNWFPSHGYSPLSDGVSLWLRSLALPCLSLGIMYAALIARITRASTAQSLSEDYILTARAKGISDTRLLLRHALPNAAIPIATITGLSMAALLGGILVAETVFAIPGIGLLVVDAALSRDYPVIQGITLVFAVMYVALNLLVDLSYMIFDPRIRY